MIAAPIRKIILIWTNLKTSQIYIAERFDNRMQLFQRVASIKLQAQPEVLDFHAYNLATGYDTKDEIDAIVKRLMIHHNYDGRSAISIDMNLMSNHYND
jgi:hypothetical protein